ncbi:PatB family C-S lyase [Bacillus shivajii]|uniref:MalY/PatB family protein n=1 Tax=Bacillus shivajii TaxID=1983719 RepID=UPI001CFA5F51|nr:PatB family C-S lyase [Bacillus shivajii]UCZ53599.1 PatB family C-S lyase [Bacillus shivajii]
MSFNQVISRKGTSSLKWDMTKAVFGTDDILPMWVADMDFSPPQAVIDALNERVNHGVFGYTYVGDSVSEAIIDWQKRRHTWNVKKSWLLYSPGVVKSIATIIQALTVSGDKVLVQSPIYEPFLTIPKANDRELVNCPLVQGDSNYEIDFEAFEASLKNGVKLFILCHPHNPVGRVWKKEELTTIAELCEKYDVTVVSDEIHSDLVYKPHTHIPFASLSEEIAKRTITLIAPSKTFNLAGLQVSAMISENVEYRKKIKAIHKSQGQFTLNPLGISAMEAAYKEGDEWLENLLDYLKGNVDLVNRFLSEHLPKVKMIDIQATYLVWLDCRELGYTDEDLKKLLIHKGRLGLEAGPKFGQGGEGFVRMNIACPREVVQDGLLRLKKAFE